MDTSSDVRRTLLVVTVLVLQDDTMKYESGNELYDDIADDGLMDDRGVAQWLLCHLNANALRAPSNDMVSIGVPLPVVL